MAGCNGAPCNKLVTALIGLIFDVIELQPLHTTVSTGIGRIWEWILKMKYFILLKRKFHVIFLVAEKEERLRHSRTGKSIKLARDHWTGM